MSFFTRDKNRFGENKYVVTVIWRSGDIWAPVGLHYFVFDDKEEAEVFFTDKDRALRQRWEYNWLNQGNRFWTARILVILTQRDGRSERGWQGFTLSDEEVVSSCLAREMDPEPCLAERAKLLESHDVPLWVGWKKE